MKRLTTRQIGVLYWLSCGSSRKETAYALACHRKTVANDIRRICLYLEAKTLPHAVRIGRDLGLI